MSDDRDLFRLYPEDDDPIARRLRRALAEEAEMVRPQDRLQDITQRIDQSGSHRRWAPWVAGLAAAAVAGVVAGAVITMGDEDGSQQAGQPTASVPQGTATSEPSATGSPEQTTPPADQELTGIPVYWIGQSKTRPWLYREFRTVPDTGGPIASAVSAMTQLKPSDPDYSTPWRPASRVEVSRSGKALTVDLSADAFTGSNVGSQVAGLAVQQLVYTATAAAAQAGDPADTVTITVDGKAADVWGVLRVGEPTARADVVDVQAPTWVLSPAQGQTVDAGTVRFTGYGTAFEGNFLWEVRGAGGKVVADGFTTGGSMGTYGEFSFSAELEPGEYTVEVYQPDESGGEGAEGPRMFPDTKDFTVR